ncbi:MAG: hypothetical protein GY736_14580 [Sphingomonas sp.]|nr:hypothetical protein [Sphingomonas sp.]
MRARRGCARRAATIGSVERLFGLVPRLQLGARRSAAAIVEATAGRGRVDAGPVEDAAAHRASSGGDGGAGES